MKLTKIWFEGEFICGVDEEGKDATPNELQAFFLKHKEINIAEFAKRININPTLLRNYINGFKKPSKERTELIIQGIKDLGTELVNSFK